MNVANLQQTQKQAVPGEPIRILILEDSAVDAELVANEIRNAKIDFVSRQVETEKAFRMELDRFRPDIILSDYSLPAFDGLSALAIARELCPDVPFVLISGAIGEELAIDILKKGATDYVLKDRLSRLAPAVRRALDEARERDERRRAEQALDDYRVEIEMQNQELRQTQEYLEESRNRYQDLYDFAPVGYLSLDGKGRIREINLTGARQLGKDRSLLIGSPFLSCVAVADARKFLNHLQRCRETSGEVTTEIALPADEQEPRYVQVISVRSGETGGKADLYRTMITDITERKIMEEGIRRAEQNYRNIFDNAVEGIFQTTPGGRYISANPALARMMGYDSPEDLISGVADIGRQVYANPGRRQEFKDAIEKDTFVSGFEYRALRKDKKIIWISENARVILDENGRPLYYEGFVVDITERKRTEDEIREVRDQLRALASELVLTEERERKQIATVLHDRVAQTLAAAKMKIELVGLSDRGDPDPLVKETSDLLSQSIKETRTLMAELSPPVLYELGFPQAMEWMAENIQTQHGLEVDFVCDDELKPMDHDVKIFVYQAARELLTNAAKHARAKIARFVLSNEENAVRIEVSDDGIGFDPARIGLNAAERTGGFGLFSIRERLKHFGGQLDIRSENAKGSTITLVIPGRKKKNRKQR